MYCLLKHGYCKDFLIVVIIYIYILNQWPCKRSAEIRVLRKKFSSVLHGELCVCCYIVTTAISVVRATGGYVLGVVLVA